MIISPTPTNPHNNPFEILNEWDDCNEETVVTSNVSHGNEKAHHVAATPPHQPMWRKSQAWTKLLKAENITLDDSHSNRYITRAVEWAVSDLGATSHFIMEGAPVVNKRVALNPITVKLPDGTKLRSTHTCNLDIPWLPNHITEAHIIPGMAHSSLISTRKFCNTGCRVVFDLHECRVYYRGNLVLSGTRDPRTELWRLPINPTTPGTNRSHIMEALNLTAGGTTPIPHTAANVYTIPYRQNQVKYIHQTFFSPTIPTLLKAINNDQMEGIPFMKAAMVRRHLPPSPATSKGHMKRPCAGIRSTRKIKTRSQKLKPIRCGKIHPNAIRTTPHLVPDDEPLDGANNIFCFAALADKNELTLYTDATGALPVRSLDGNQYYFIAYDYDLNYIFAVPIPDLTDDTIVGAFDSIFTNLKKKGFAPKFNVTDNQAATAIKKFLTKEECKWQFVEPSNHRVNAAERAIQTHKNHFISGLCTTDTDWPLQLWDQLTEQAVLTLNILRTSRIDPSKSAYHACHGHKYNWNSHPMAPPGTKAIVYEAPEGRRSWGTRGLDAWYCGPALNHYRNCEFYIPATRGYRTSGSFDLFPQHCQLPTLNEEEHAEEVMDELIGSMKKMKKKFKTKLLGKLKKAIKIIATNEAQIERVAEGTELTPDSEGEGEGEENFQQRVVPAVTTSTNPTDTRELKLTKPGTHGRRTRGNIPGKVPVIVRDETAPTQQVRRSKHLNPDNIELIKPINYTPFSQ